MNKYALLLNFENAGIFRKSWKEDNKSRSKDDRVFNRKNHDLRTQSQWDNFETNTLRANYIEGVLNVLCCKRPKSKFRDTCVEPNEQIVNLANNSLVKINSLTLKNKEEKDVYIYEKITTRKCLDNSWNVAGCSSSWTKMKYLLSEENFDKLKKTSIEILGEDCLNETFDNVSNELFKSKDLRVDDLIKMAKENKAEPLAKLLTGNKVHSLQQAGFRGLGAYLKTLVTKGVANIARIDGEILVTLTEDEVNLFKQGPGFATILEGGFVTIKELIDLKYVNFEDISSGFKKVVI
jgi:hypothetical protein